WPRQVGTPPPQRSVPAAVCSPPALLEDDVGETGTGAGVACDPDLIDLDEERVAVAVESDGPHVLVVPSGLALHPLVAPAAGPVRGGAGGEGTPQRRPGHPREHEDLTAVVLLDDRGHEPRVVGGQPGEHLGIDVYGHRYSSHEARFFPTRSSRCQGVPIQSP